MLNGPGGKDSAMNRKKLVILILLIIILGSSLRFFEITKHDVWIDESFVVEICKTSTLGEILSIQKFDQGHPPVYLFFLKVWTDIFGYSPFSIRFPSVVFGVISILAIFSLTKMIFNSRVGLMSSFLLALSPFHIYYSQMARSYSLIILFSILSISFFYSYITNKKKISLLYFIIFSLILYYTHFLSILLIGFTNIFVFFVYRKTLKEWIFSQALLFFCLIPLPYLMNKGVELGAGARSSFSALELVYLCVIFSIGYTGFIFKMSTIKTNILDNLGFLLISFFTYLSIVYFFLKKGWKNRTNSEDRLIKVIKPNKDNKPNRAVFVLLWFAIPVLILFFISLFYPLFRPRYLCFIFPAFIIIIAQGIMSIKGKQIFYLILTLLIIIQVIPIYNYFFIYTREPWQEISEYISENQEQDDLIITSRTSSLRYYYQGESEIRFIDIGPEELTKYKGIWLVLANYKQSYSDETHEISMFLAERYNLITAKEYRDDSNELSGRIIIQYYKGEKK